MKIIERTLQEIGQSLLVTLPKQWTKTLKLKKGSTVKMLISEQGNLSIVPEFIQEVEEKEVTLPYDEHFPRRFFREYFFGYEKIIILHKQEIGGKKRKQLYSPLRPPGSSV